jgi:predicted site-specific integrase-resolvase
MEAGNEQKLDRLCTRREVAEALHVCVRTVVRLEKAGKLKPVKGISPRLVFFRASDIAQIIAEHWQWRDGAGY